MKTEQMIKKPICLFMQFSVFLRANYKKETKRIFIFA